MNETRNDANVTVDEAENEITETTERRNESDKMDEAENEITGTIERKNDGNDTMNEAKNEVTEPVEERNNENDTMDEAKALHKVRRSSRQRKQRMEINPDEIGDCDDKNDLDYK